MLENQYILLAEDDPGDILLIQRAFRRVGQRDLLKLVHDGDEAIHYLSGCGIYSNRERFPLPFMLLLDLKMLGTNGFDVLEWVRAQPEFKRLLIVVLTSSNHQADVDRAYELGANSYLVKPVEFSDVVNLIQRFEVYWTEMNRFQTSPGTDKTVRPESVLG
jgi:CheY-like chemotaxis protein